MSDLPVYNGLRGDQRNLQANTVIDVLVPWTARAECKNSGLSNGCTRTSTTQSNMRAKINLAIQETNAAYDMSGVNLELRLAHAYYVGYTEASTDAFGTALDHLKGTTDGFMDNVHAKRTQYGAGKRYLNADILNSMIYFI